MTTAPWMPGVPTVLIGNMPALDMNCKCVCAWGGMIQITAPGQFQADGERDPPHCLLTTT